jgi:hypothetical protein
MKNDIIYEVWGVQKGREKDNYFSSFRTTEEADQHIEKLKTDWWNGAWQSYHDDFVIREKVVTTDFEIPSQPMPRDRYTFTTEAIKNKPGTWDSTQVRIFDGDKQVAEYTRNYSMLRTFEPFRKNGHDYALISPSYTATSVMDLETGKIIASEPQNTWGFCPVGFYVPDWWDTNDGSILPGSHYWDEDDEWPTGDFGFVWGCVWGDDSSWKVQYLDLSQIEQGIINRDERFGYVQLATNSKDPKEFIRVSKEGSVRVQFSVELYFDLKTGKANKWSIDHINREE